jgi:hypothetical protein
MEGIINNNPFKKNNYLMITKKIYKLYIIAYIFYHHIFILIFLKFLNQSADT